MAAAKRITAGRVNMRAILGKEWMNRNKLAQRHLPEPSKHLSSFVRQKEALRARMYQNFRQTILEVLYPARLLRFKNNAGRQSQISFPCVALGLATSGRTDNTQRL